MNLKDLIAESHSLVPIISCKEFHENSHDYLVIDVRESSEISEAGSIKNAINIPRGLIEMKISLANQSETLNTSSKIVVYCGGGSRAALAGKTLKEMGFKNVFNLEGGYRGWKKFRI